MGQVIAFPGPRSEAWVSKAQLAAYLGRSKRWIELRAREGDAVADDRWPAGVPDQRGRRLD